MCLEMLRALFRFKCNPSHAGFFFSPIQEVISKCKCGLLDVNMFYF